MIRLPGLIDPHVHLRYLDPDKEDFLTGNHAAIAGGFTMVLDMPNNRVPITTLSRLQAKIAQAHRYTKYDIGFYFGSLGDNLDQFEKVQDLVFGLKLYLNQTTGDYIIDEPIMKKIYQKWHAVTKGEKPILLHAEVDMLSAVARVVAQTNQPTHICHVSSRQELTQIMDMKRAGLPVTCGVTPHHLFLTKADEKRLGPYGRMKPTLQDKRDQDFLWQHFSDIDVVESDHAPHTRAEKESAHPPYGVPGLETTLPLLLTAMHQDRITKDDIVSKCFTRPKEIFHTPDQPGTFVEVDETKTWRIKNENLFTKCKWSPFDGWRVIGKVDRVSIRGKIVFAEGKHPAKAGFGKVTQSK